MEIGQEVIVKCPKSQRGFVQQTNGDRVVVYLEMLGKLYSAPVEQVEPVEDIEEAVACDAMD